MRPSDRPANLSLAAARNVRGYASWRAFLRATGLSKRSLQRFISREHVGDAIVIRLAAELNIPSAPLLARNEAFR
jgi:hypothetical protein